MSTIKSLITDLNCVIEDLEFQADKIDEGNYEDMWDVLDYKNWMAMSDNLNKIKEYLEKQ